MIRKIIKLFQNEYIFAVINKFLTTGLSLVQSILVARYLGKEIQGISASILSIVSIGAIVITFGMHQAYPYYRKERGKESIYTDFISIITFLFGCYFIFAAVIAAVFVQDFVVRTAVILIPLYGYNRVVSYICLIENPNQRNKWWTIISFADIVFIILLICFVDRSVGSAIAILAFAETCKCIVYTIMLGQRPHFHKGLYVFAKELFLYGFFPMVALLMTTLNYKIDILMLRAFPFITNGQIGVYSIGMSFADKIAIIPDTLKGILISKLSKGADEHEVAKVSRLCFWASSLICIMIWILGEPLINLLYGREYSGAYSVLLICSIGSIFVGYFKLIAQYNIVNKKQIRNVVLLSGSIVINIVLNLLLIPKYGLNGAAFASGVGYFTTGFVFVIWFARKNGIRMSEMFLPQKEDMEALKKVKKK